MKQFIPISTATLFIAIIAFSVNYIFNTNWVVWALTSPLWFVAWYALSDWLIEQSDD